MSYWKMRKLVWDARFIVEQFYFTVEFFICQRDVTMLLLIVACFINRLINLGVFQRQNKNLRWDSIHGLFSVEHCKIYIVHMKLFHFHVFNSLILLMNCHCKLIVLIFWSNNKDFFIGYIKVWVDKVWVLNFRVFLWDIICNNLNVWKICRIRNL